MQIQRLCRIIPALFALLLTGACAAAPLSPGGTPSALDPHGPAAAHLASLWWVMFWIGTVIWLLVIGLMFAAVLRRRRSTPQTKPDDANPDTGRNWPLSGMALSVVVLAVVFGYNVYTLAAVQNPNGEPPVKILVVGRRWWWEVRYQDRGFETANEIHIPVGVPVQLQLESADVIHSFWVPQLHGKMDVIPTRINYLTIQADEPGIYRGECAEFCGLQHAQMGILVIAQSKSDYNAWLDAQTKAASDPQSAAARKGQQVYLAQGCAFCHTVRGLDDQAVVRTAVRLGPDLTHLQSRLTIAGASRTLNVGNLTGWVMNAQQIKPGALMPDRSMSSQDLLDLIAYLETLH